MDVRDDRDPHSRLTLAQRLAVLAAAAGAIAAGILLWRTEVPDLALPDLDPGDYFSAAELDRIDDYRRVSRLLYLGGLLAEMCVLALCVWKARPLDGTASTPRAWADPHGRPRRPGGRARRLAVAPSVRCRHSRAPPRLRAQRTGLGRVADRPADVARGRGGAGVDRRRGDALARGSPREALVARRRARARGDRGRVHPRAAARRPAALQPHRAPPGPRAGDAHRGARRADGRGRRRRPGRRREPAHDDGERLRRRASARRAASFSTTRSSTAASPMARSSPSRPTSWRTSSGAISGRASRGSRSSPFPGCSCSHGSPTAGAGWRSRTSSRSASRSRSPTSSSRSRSPTRSRAATKRRPTGSRYVRRRIRTAPSRSSNVS